MQHIQRCSTVAGQTEPIELTCSLLIVAVRVRVCVCARGRVLVVAAVCVLWRIELMRY